MGNEKKEFIDIKLQNMLRFATVLYKQGLTLPDIIKKVLFSKEDRDEFLIGVQVGDKLCVVSLMDEEFKEYSLKSMEKECIIETFRNICKNRDKDFVEYFRCTLGWRLAEDDFSLYYYANMNKRDSVDFYYISEIEKEYYIFFCDALLYILSVPNIVSIDDLHHYFASQSTIRNIPQNAYISFVDTIEKHFSIDINLILELSGNYYEGEACKACLAFQLMDKEFDKKVTLKEPILLKKEHVRLIRKMLQAAGQGNQFLLLKKRDKVWEIVALCLNDKEFTGYIRFSILGHMAWKMEMENNVCLCFRSGQLEIREDGYYADLLKRKYKEAFDQDFPSALSTLFDKVSEQRHGTVMVIEEESAAETEVLRFKRESSGIELCLDTLNGEFIDGITSIDGAILVDENGKCYGMGYILDGKSPLAGRPDRGARYNSTARYIFSLKNEKKIGIAVVVSEDKTIDIISTNDDFEKEQEELNGDTM